MKGLANLLKQRFLYKILGLVLLIILIAPLFRISKVVGSVVEKDQKISNLILSSLDGEDLKWELKADYAFLQKDGDRALLEQINLHYFLIKGNDVIIRGEKAEIEFSTNQIFLKGGVRADSRHGITLEAETLLWNGYHRSISSDDKVIIRRPDFEISGTGLEADITLENVKIKADAKTIIY